MKRINIGSRESRLAVVQAEMVRDMLLKAHPDIEVEIKTYKTTGDIILDRTLDKVGGKGLFVKELEKALIEGKVDLLVHSCKDVPMEVNGDIPIVGAVKREDERDVLVLPKGVTELNLDLPIGCSSKRRTIQVQKLYPNCTVKPVRGNVLTRLEKLDRGEYSALILAAAGIKRLGLEERITKYFSPDEILPAACQGILALQARKDFDVSLLNGINDPDTIEIAKAERSFVRTLDGGCSSPVAAHAVLNGEEISITGLFAKEDGTEYIIDSAAGKRNYAENLAVELAKELKERGKNL